MKLALLLGVSAVIVAALVVIGLRVTGDDDGSGNPKDAKALSSEEIDHEAWLDDLVAAGLTRAAIDLPALEELTRDDCTKSADDFVLPMTLTGYNIPVVRVNIKHVCPDRLPVFDEGVKQYDELVGSTERLCNSDPTTLSTEEADRYDAVCVDY